LSKSIVGTVSFFVLAFSCPVLWASPADYAVGAFYYQKGRSGQPGWKDIRGAAGSRSPGMPWPDREPLLGFYTGEEPAVAEKHIEWASRYGIRFFAYDWQWNVDRPLQERALKNYLTASNRSKLQFCLLWSYPAADFAGNREFDAMVSYWIGQYFDQPTYYRIKGKPVVFLAAPHLAELEVRKFGATVADLLARARRLADERGTGGIYFVLTTDEKPCSDLEQRVYALGFDAYTGRNYAEGRGARIADYDRMVDEYIAGYRAAAAAGRRIPYLAIASPGRDERPGAGGAAIVMNNPSPAKFERMLRGAKQLLDAPGDGPKVLMIEAWNDFDQGAFIEPTRKWGVRYLESIRKVLGISASQ